MAVGWGKTGNEYPSISHKDSISHNGQKVKIIQMSNNCKWVNKIWFIHIIECYSAKKGSACYDMDEP